jgi:drug/metabolite transporter (DMT)-like permease
MRDLFIGLAIVSEFILGLYSLLIKSVPTNLSTQVLARMLTYMVAATVLGSSMSRLPSLSAQHLVTMGLLNSVHVASSYYAFKELPSAVSLSLFYIYPFFNILFSKLFLDEKITTAALPWLAMSFVGMLFIIFPVQTDEKPVTNWLPYLSIIVSALTESLIYIAFRSGYEPTEFQGVLHLYGGGLLATLLARAANIIEPFDFKWSTWKPLLLFNLVIGFIGYSTLFTSIPQIPVEVFASLAFFGVLSGFVFGEVGGEARPGPTTFIGAAAIIVAAVAVRLLKIERT